MWALGIRFMAFTDVSVEPLLGTSYSRLTAQALEQYATAQIDRIRRSTTVYKEAWTISQHRLGGHFGSADKIRRSCAKKSSTPSSQSPNSLPSPSHQTRQRHFLRPSSSLPHQGLRASYPSDKCARSRHNLGEHV
ncbi:uncharacterized protein ACHE_30640A [Aspergillus chevalieri]|uniref:Uncharacterized protein n=1 Tax=Aspergillus chevalieri TaxID=182096 RepID=A0A7R7VL15_ASPCH|nr:uncharacterized protein ACHE_30640A [Aspergillus chevalieri]BCR86653.1 hypothetical protein ACHE_30640A [Aspergillus chevalieri]